ncbi:MAG: SGNH/GDSL hydrolase family protein [Candidatus Levybacteria bacterium]|nr:SGNH/GDSL hydrolase family protein [Candidatus Levybacteria bacterium]
MKNILPLLLAAFFIFAAFFLYNNLNKKLVKGVLITPIAQVSPTPNPTLTPASTPIPYIIPKKASYAIAIFGDSQVDTMGEKLEYLQETLAGEYPKTQFNLYNYGIGGQNVEQGLARFESSFVNRERQYPPLPALLPDVLIIGSFAYNPFPTHDRNKHYTLLKELAAKAKYISSRVYLLAEIAPLKTGFGKGKNGVNMTEEVALEHASHIIEQLDNVINLSNAENVPLINVYYESRIEGSFGDPYFVNKDDGIHPSVAGHYFTAESIVEKIRLD